MASDQPTNVPHPFDVRTVKYLARLMSEHDLSEIDLFEGERRIRLRRGPRGVAVAPTVALPAATATSAFPAAPATKPAAPEKPLLPIKSEAIGIFYAQQKEGDPPLVAVGSRVGPNTVVGVIEAMKLYNDVKAECSGVIVEICVENAQAVEFGTVLFKVDPAG